MDILNFVLSLVFAYIGCFGFGYIFHIRGKLLFITPIGGVIIWASYLLLEGAIEPIIIRTLLATMIVAVFCEIIARLMKTPVTVFMIISILPLVPGSGIYYTMQACIESNYNAFIERGIETIGIAGAIAVGMLIISTIFKMGTIVLRHFKQNKKAAR